MILLEGRSCSFMKTVTAAKACLVLFVLQGLLSSLSLVEDI